MTWSTGEKRLIELKTKIETIQTIMAAYVTGDQSQDRERRYRTLFADLGADLESLSYPNPNLHVTLGELWNFVKMRGMDTYAERRVYVRELYADVLLDIERRMRSDTRPPHWDKANEQLTDEFEPVRRQWLKAKNFIYVDPPDIENSIKESMNSVESVLKILTGDTQATLGQSIKQLDIDEDIRRLISHAYGLASNKDFVRHGGTKVEDLDVKEAEFFLEFAAISIVYLKEKVKSTE